MKECREKGRLEVSEDLFEADVYNILKDKNISAQINRKVPPNPSHNGGEIDIETNNIIFECTAGTGSKKSQIEGYVDNFLDFNPNKKDIILYGPKYTNTSAKNDITNLSKNGITVKVINEFEDFLKLF